MLDFTDWVRRRPTAVRAARLLLLVAYIALLVVEAKTRRPWNDEVIFVDPAISLMTEGRLGSKISHEGDWRDFDTHFYSSFPGYPVLLAGWFSLFGVSLLSLRASQMLAALLLLYALHGFVRRTTGDRAVAWVAVFVAGFDYFFLVAAGFGRYEPLVAALGIGGYAAYVALRERRLGAAVVVSQTLVCLSGVVQPMGVMYFLGLLVITLWLDRRRFAWKYVGLAAIPYLAIGAAWGAYVLDNPPAFQQQMSSQLGDRYREAAPGPLATIGQELRMRYLHAFGLPERASSMYSGPVMLKLLVLAAYVAGLVACLVWAPLRRKPGTAPLLVLLAVHQGVLTFLDGARFHFYLIHTLPLLGVLLAAFGVELWRRAPRLRLPIAVAAATLFALQVGGVALRIRTNTYAPYARFAEVVRETVAPDELLIGPSELAFDNGFRAGNLLDDARLGLRTGRKPLYLAVADRHEWNFEAWKRAEPETYRFIRRRLDEEYELIHQEDVYRLYRLRPEHGPPTPPPGR
jgi:4-amino-4-deoxy-L-arabinose transferase-like glycosyltransferase